MCIYLYCQLLSIRSIVAAKGISKFAYYNDIRVSTNASRMVCVSRSKVAETRFLILSLNYTLLIHASVIMDGAFAWLTEDEHN